MYFLVCYETEAVNSVYLSTWVKHSINKSFCFFFLLSEAVIFLLFNDFKELTIDVHKYLDVLLACQNALSLGMPASIISTLSLIVIKELFLVLLWWLFPSGVPVTVCFEHCISKRKPRMDSFSYRLGYIKDFFQQESGCFPQEASVHLVKRCTMGFFFTCWYFVLMSRTQKCELQTLAQRDVARWREAPVSARGWHIQCKGKKECHS